MSNAVEKDESIVQLLHQLRARLGEGGFDIVDHWEGDPSAVGIARPDNHGVLVYICTFAEDAESYFVSLELPPDQRNPQWTNHPYTPLGESRPKSFDALVEIIERHFGNHGKG